MLIVRENLWKNNLNLFKDEPMVYVHFIVVVIIVSVKKIGVITFAPSLVVKSGEAST